MGPKDAVMSCVGDYPYSIEWTYRNGRSLIAKHDGQTDKFYILN